MIVSRYSSQVRSSGSPADFLEGLIDGHGADRHRRVADDPLARLVDLLAGREIHRRVGAPQRRPTELFDLLLDRRGHGGVADVGVDLHEEVAADDHRLELEVIDVRGDDRAAARDLGSHELGRQPLAQGDELHLRRDLAATSVMELRDARLTAPRRDPRSRAASAVPRARRGPAARWCRKGEPAARRRTSSPRATGRE